MPEGKERTPAALTAALLMAAFPASLAQTIVIAALPVLRDELDVPAAQVTWTLTAFMLAGAVVTPIAGRLGDLYGHRRILVACLLLCTAGTAAAGLAAAAHSFGWLVAGRALQGTGSGAFPLALGIARSAVPARRLNGMVALVSAVFGIGGSVGMVIAGPIVDAAGTPWLFWVTLILAAAALALSVRLPATRPGGSGRVDPLGAVLLSATLVCLLLAISQGRAWGWGSPRVTGLFAGSAAALAVFTAAELRVRAPLVDLRALRGRGPLTTNLATLVVCVAMFGSITLVPQFVQAPRTSGYGFGLSASAAGLLMVPMAALMLLAGPAAPRIARRAGSRVPLQAGTVCAVAAFALLAWAHGALWEVYLACAVIGVGYGLAFASIGNLVVENAAPGQTGAATGVNTIVRTVGAAIGAQLVTAILAARTASAGAPAAESGYTAAFAVLTVTGAIALVIAAAIPRRTGGARDSQRSDGADSGNVQVRALE
ncbi:MFS transporter [Actinomadura sp. NTSP31]|uniref:MFS transporter n=1 Tax=Actinomadura sp. NTSP31 TaxID=1735447 RepID=UPI0035C01AB7